MDAFDVPALVRLIEELPEAVLATHCQHGDATACVRARDALRALSLLRDDRELAFDMLSDLCAVDRLGAAAPAQAEGGQGAAAARFEVVYHLYSTVHGHRLRLKIPLAEDAAETGVESATDLWPAAAWLEREVWDLYGIPFSGHPDLRRLLLYDEFVGHPLRKDYPKRRRQPLIGPGH